MRELRLKYLINLVSDIAARAKTDEQALTMAQDRIREALGRTGVEATRFERTIVRAMTLGAKGAKEHADRISYLALRYQDLRKAAEGASMAVQKVQGLAGGAAAGAYTLDRFARAPMEYSDRLTRMANTAYSDRDESGWKAGRQALNAAITAAIRTGGGTRDDAAETLDSLISSGAVSGDQAMRLLPMLMKASTASGARATDLGTIALRGMQGFGIQLNEIPEVLNMALVAGKAGGFELRDMAKWLPQAMASGTLSGMSGKEDLRRLLASMQAQVITAGSKDQAGNNLVNLLGKINSRDTAKDMEKEGIDLSGYLAKKRGEGVGSLDAFVQMVDGMANKDAQYTALRAQLANAGNSGERQRTLAAMTDIMQGKSIGRALQDREAMMALVAEMNNRGLVDRVQTATRGNLGALSTDFQRSSQELAFTRQAGLNEGAIAADNALKAVEPALSAVGKTAAQVAQDFPNLTTGVVLATGALGVFTAALTGSSLIGALGGRGKPAPPGVVGRTTAFVGAGVASAAAAARNGLSTGTSWMRAAPLLAPLLAAWTTSDEEMEVLRNADRRRQGYRGKGFVDPRIIGSSPTAAATLALTSPNNFGPDQPALNMSAGGRLDLGEGKVSIDVRVSDERVQHTVGTQSSPTLKLNPGNTNPAGYRGAGGSW